MLRCLTLLQAISAVCISSLLATAAPPKIDFNRDVRSILSNNCFQCHGPDDHERKGNNPAFRLDTFDGATVDLGGSSAILPGNPDKSELISRITTGDADLKMPPPETGKKLSEKEIQVLKDWIQQGASYSQHWAYVPPQRAAVPDLQGSTWPKNPIDNFTLEAMQRQGLQPQPEADRYTLIRRVALDTTGLPPSWEEVQLFVNDPSPDAYPKMVARFLAKEDYGEHWARMWLDLARYADSSGYADDPARTIWAYRDYVIRAFNKNMPFDQFTIEQIAGDMLPDPTEDQLIATAFHRNTMTNNEGGTNDEEFRNVAVIDRVNTTYAVWMGTTAACAQCHTHKYDPFSQKEYFESVALLNNTADADLGDERPTIELWSDEQRRRKSELQSEIEQLKQVLSSPTEELAKSQSAWEANLPKNVAWKTLPQQAISSSNGVSYKQLEDQSVLALNSAEKETTTVLSTFANAAKVTALRLEALTDASLPNQGPGWGGGNFVLSGLNATLIPPAHKTVTGQFVRIEIPGEKKILSLAEVEVQSGNQNVARGGTATQSTTSFEGAASRAIDGNTNGVYYEANSVTHTDPNGDNPWWEVDLGKETSVDQIVVWNRTDGAVLDRLKPFRVTLLDSNRKVIWERTIAEAPNPNIALPVEGKRAITFQAAFADFEQSTFPAKQLLDRQAAGSASGWAVGGALGKSHSVVLIAKEPFELEAGSALQVNLEFQSQFAQHTLGRFRLSVSDEPRTAELARIPESLFPIVNKSSEQRTADEQASLAGFYRTIAPELEATRQKLAAAEQELASQKPFTTVPVMRELATDARRKTRVQLRGNFMDLADEVSEGVPAVFVSAKSSQPKTRLEFARWLVSRDNPLTARVTVNRFWEQLFGTGIVATAEEFGSQGDAPTHPALLDWLACEFMDSGWDVKHMLELMLTSATYRQSARVTDAAYQADSDNRWLARGPRFRLPAETIRDQALAVSGLLSKKRFGVPVRPPQPSLGLSAAFGSSTDWQTSAGEDRYRRGIYTTWRRSNPYPSMTTFDAPNREVCTLRRIRTNTPLQALVTLNDPVFIEASQALARNMVRNGSTALEHAQFGIQAALSRPASEKETEALVRLFERTRAKYANDSDKAMKMATDPLGPLPEGASVVDMAAWTVVANAILNLDEMIMRR